MKSVIYKLFKIFFQITKMSRWREKP